MLENVPETATIHREEVFGPTVNLYPVDDLDEAIAKANASTTACTRPSSPAIVNIAFRIA